jgi:hypothetical protein
MTTAWRAIHIDEPRLSFGHDQGAEHPKDGLFLFGPVASGQNPARMDVGVIATPAGLEKYSKWIASIEKFIEVRRQRRTASETTPTPSSGLASKRSTAPPGRASRSRRA